MNKIKAWIFVHVLRPWLPHDESIKDCPMCGELLQWYDDYGWLHMSDGDADCYGALSHGKGKPR